MKKRSRQLRPAIKNGLLVVTILALACGSVMAQVDLHKDLSSEIMNAWNQAVTDTAFDDTLAPADTVWSKAIDIGGIYSGRPQYFCAAIILETLSGHPTPAFEADFWVKIGGGWFSNYDDSHLFITSPWSVPDSLLYPLTVYGGDSLKFRYWAADSCIVKHWHWHAH